MSDEPMDYFDWAERYEVTSDEPLEWEDVKDHPKEFIWTQVDTDEGPRIVSGVHYVNRLAYFLTRWSHRFEHIEVD
jgi:hypothetical protein